MKTKLERFVVELTDSERSLPKGLIGKGGRSVSVLGRARVLLKADRGKTDVENAEFSEVSLSTVFVIGSSKEDWSPLSFARTLASGFTVNLTATLKRR